MATWKPPVPPAVEDKAKKTPAKKAPAKKAESKDGSVRGRTEGHGNLPDSKKKSAGDARKDAKKKAKFNQKKYDDAFAMYGWQKAMIESSPELKKLFAQALKEGWSQAQFVAKAQNTNWFKSNGLAWRENEAKRLQDPGTWRQEKKTRIANLSNIAQRMGAQLSPTQTNTIADQWMSLGWDETQVIDALEQYIAPSTTPGDLQGQYVGAAGEVHNALIQFAKRNAYKIPEGSLAKWVKSVAMGEATVEDYEMFIRRQTAAAYSAFADEIMAGADLMDVASPYINAYQRLLETPDVSVEDRLIQEALNQPGGKDGKPVAMPLYEFNKKLKEDPRWMATENAKEEIEGKGDRIMSLLGL